MVVSSLPIVAVGTTSLDPEETSFILNFVERFLRRCGKQAQMPISQQHKYILRKKENSKPRKLPLSPNVIRSKKDCSEYSCSV